MPTRHRSLRPTLLAALLAATPMLSLAGQWLPAGELPGDMILQIEAPAPQATAVIENAAGASSTAYIETMPTTIAAQYPSRLHVREQVQVARDTGTLTPAGEIGDSEHVLAARDAFNAAQAEQIVAEQNAYVARLVAEQSVREVEILVAQAMYMPDEFIVEVSGEDEWFDAVPMVWMSPELT